MRALYNKRQYVPFRRLKLDLLSCSMPPRRDNDFMVVNSDSDISIEDDYRDKVKGKGKAKPGGKGKADKGKGKAKDAVCNYLWILIKSLDVPTLSTASLYMGGLIYTLLGYCPRRRSRQSPNFS